jgi:hypothetical protein
MRKYQGFVVLAVAIHTWNVARESLRKISSNGANF